MKFTIKTPILAATFLLGDLAQGANLQDLPVLNSSAGLLDVLMVARAAPLSSLGSGNPVGWVYDICPRPANGVLNCPPSTANLYGGTRLALKAGDTLKVRLVNQLPPAPHARHAAEAPYLASNPTNLHTHGLLVSPRYPTAADPTYGDTIFVLTLNPANAPLPGAGDAQHLHSDLRLGYTDYKIAIPAGHPSGMYWFHPHAHGLALNQVSSGMAGMITIGNVLDYVCAGQSCANYAATIPVRHMLLKDTQVVAGDAGAEVQDQEDPQFCAQQPAQGESSPRRGRCPGATVPVDPEGGSATYPGGNWFFSINGQPAPTIPVATAQGEIWRITAASGSAIYDLRLQDAAKRDMVVQVLSVDGVAVAGPKSGSLFDWLNLGSSRLGLVPCPGTGSLLFGLLAQPGAPACANRIVMMPSSRVELWVAYRDASGALASAPPAGASATLRSVGYSSGGDDWPAVDLALVSFGGPARKASDPLALSIAGSATSTMMDPATLAAQLKNANAAFASEPGCRPLAAGHGRRVFFGNVETPDGGEGFALAHEEIDALGIPVPGTFVPLGQFDPQRPSICVSLNTGNTANTEFWQIVNLTDEDHNFHLHQLRFWLMKDPSGSSALASPNTLTGNEIAYDNLPLRHGSSACTTVQAWRDAYNPLSPHFGRCDGKPVRVAIPFAIAGDFVYHCHILEHEDGGMMASIRVRSSAK